MATTRWQRADSKTKLSVAGYLRRIERGSRKIQIPLAITCYCISYYYLKEYFTAHGNNITVNPSGNVASGKTVKHRFNVVYGNQIINASKSLDMINHKYNWTFKISQTDPDNTGFWIGINDSKKQMLNDVHLAVKSYYFTNDGGMFGTFGLRRGKYPWRKEAKIEMKLVGSKAFKHGCDRDLKPLERNEEICEWQIIFSINGQGADDLKVKVKPSTYHLAVLMSEKGQSIEILNFEFDDK